MAGTNRQSGTVEDGMSDNQFYRQITPDDEAEMNDLTEKILKLFLENEVDRNCACTVMVHIISHLIDDRQLIEIYSKEIIKLWNMYKRERDELDKYS